MEKLDIIYIRTSTDQQNPENQLPDIQTIVPAVAKVYIEHQSAWKDHLNNRPVFRGIMELIKAGKVRSFNVWDLDRIYRNRVMTIEFMHICGIKGVIVRSFRQQFLNDFDKLLDTVPKDNPMYWMIKDMVTDMRERMIKTFAWIAEEESNKKSDRVKIAYKHHQGKKWGRPETKLNQFEVMRKYEELGSLRKTAAHFSVGKSKISEIIKKALKEVSEKPTPQIA